MGGGGAGWTSAGSNLSKAKLNFEFSTSFRARRTTRTITTTNLSWRRYTELELSGMPAHYSICDPCFNDDRNMHHNHIVSLEF
jgi:hypothetical protein